MTSSTLTKSHLIPSSSPDSAGVSDMLQRIQSPQSSFASKAKLRAVRGGNGPIPACFSSSVRSSRRSRNKGGSCFSFPFLPTLFPFSGSSGGRLNTTRGNCHLPPSFRTIRLKGCFSSTRVHSTRVRNLLLRMSENRLSNNSIVIGGCKGLSSRGVHFVRIESRYGCAKGCICVVRSTSTG
jgi:hypothetical protein